VTEEECEQAIRQLCHKWRNDCSLAETPNSDLRFSEFLHWVRQNYSSYLSFRTTTSVEYDVEMWFDQEFGQTWQR
jgi:hypothetical protein